MQLVGTKTYNLGVNSVTDTTITATLGGGRSGAYSLRVIKGTAAISSANPSTASDFKYEMVITAIDIN